MFLTNISVDTAHAAILDHVRPLPTVVKALRDLQGYVLAQPISMERDQPPFDRVTMDGIALRSEVNVPLRQLRIAGTQAAGVAPMELKSSDQCIEVMTGAHLPHGCDCVVPVERISVKHGVAYLDADLELKPYMNVHRRGSDSLRNDSVLQPGIQLHAAEVAVIASAGHSHAHVYRQPRIAVVSTGDELVEPGEPIADWQIRRSNSYALIAAINRNGFDAVTDAHVRDDKAVMHAQLSALIDTHDAIILSGGVSAGKFDYVPEVLKEIGITPVFHKILQRPGKPMWFGVRDDGKAVYALPGNPVSILVCFYRYVLHGLRRTTGLCDEQLDQVTLTDSVQPHREFTSFMPVSISSNNAIMKATPRPTKGSGDFISLLNTDGFVQIPAGTTTVAANTVLPLFRW